MSQNFDRHVVDPQIVYHYWSTLGRENLKAVDVKVEGSKSEVYLTLKTLRGGYSQAFVGKSISNSLGTAFPYPNLSYDTAMLIILIRFDIQSYGKDSYLEVTIGKGGQWDGHSGIAKKNQLWSGKRYFDAENKPTIFHFDIPPVLDTTHEEDV